jgi:D-glycero-alpha-D-manno-heptose 1-phosphate guanylyltransferase
MGLPNLEAVILCGGLGLRLRPAVPELPKCLAAVGDRPFLEYVLLQLRAEGIRNVVLCTGYRSQHVADYFETGKRWDMSLTYSIEKESLGTGGAVKKAGAFVHGSPFLALNGDSILDVNLAQLVAFHNANQASVTIALAQVESGERYGSVDTDAEGCVTAFREKGGRATTSVATMETNARINGGIYVMDSRVFAEIPSAPPPVSLETDVFPRLTGRRVYGYPTNGYFVDIGVPEDYAKAQRELPRRFSSC